MKQVIPHPLILLLPALWIIWSFGIETVGERLMINVSGTITESQDSPAPHAPRYITRYTLRQAGDQEITYVAGPTDASLPRSMPVGTKIDKKPWHLSYEKNEQIISDFPIAFYSGTFGIALALMLGSFLQWRRMRRD